MIDPSPEGTSDAHRLGLIAPPVRRQAVDGEVGGERAQRVGGAQHRLRPEEEPPLPALTVLELSRPEGDEVDRERVPLVADDGGRQVQAIEASRWRLSAITFSRSVPAPLHLGDHRLFFPEDAVEEVDDPLRIQQRVEPVVGAQLQQLVKLAPRLLRLVLEQVGDAQHAPRLHDLAFAVEQHLGVQQRVQDLDRAARTPRARTPSGPGRTRRAPPGTPAPPSPLVRPPR